VEGFGRYTNSLTPGLNIIDRIGNKLNMMEQGRDVPPQEVITNTLQNLGYEYLCKPLK
jgi:hypothetical protein